MAGSLGGGPRPINRRILMPPMKRTDAMKPARVEALDLDGRALALLVAVVEERSVTRAAARLALTQSAVSHGLERLRTATGDALVVRAGRGITPTAHAEHLAVQARALLDGLRALAAPAHFEPASCAIELRIAANPLQRDLLLPPLLARLRAEAPQLRLRVLGSTVPTPEMLRDPELHLVVSPRPPEVDDVAHESLFVDHYAVFHDAALRGPPASRTEYEAAEHVAVLYEDGRRLEIDRFLADRGLRRNLVAQVPDLSGVAPFIRGTPRLATLPARAGVHLLRGLARAEVPLPCPPMPMHMVWHRRWDADPLHAWLRAALRAVAAGLET